MTLVHIGTPEWNKDLPDMTDLYLVAEKEDANLMDLMLSNDYILSNRDVVIPIVAGIVMEGISRV